ncbi:unnamed protein product, partial [Amoebophrya sp. A25]
KDAGGRQKKLWNLESTLFHWQLRNLIFGNKVLKAVKVLSKIELLVTFIIR